MHAALGRITGVFGAGVVIVAVWAIALAKAVDARVVLGAGVVAICPIGAPYAAARNGCSFACGKC